MGTRSDVVLAYSSWKTGSPRSKPTTSPGVWPPRTTAGKALRLLVDNSLAELSQGMGFYVSQ